MNITLPDKHIHRTLPNIHNDWQRNRIYTILPEQQRICIGMCMVIWSEWTCRCHMQSDTKWAQPYKIQVHLASNGFQRQTTFILIIKSHWGHIRYFPLRISSGCEWIYPTWSAAYCILWLYNAGRHFSTKRKRFSLNRKVQLCLLAFSRRFGHFWTIGEICWCGKPSKGYLVRNEGVLAFRELERHLQIPWTSMDWIWCFWSNLTMLEVWLQRGECERF